MEKKLQFYLKNLIHNKGSDLHLKSGAIIRLRINGDLLKLGNQEISHEELDGIAQSILSEKQYKELVSNKELDCTYVLDENNRFRVNFFYQLNGLSAVLRIIPVKILTLTELALPSIITELSEMHRGLFWSRVQPGLVNRPHLLPCLTISIGQKRNILLRLKIL